MTSFLVNDTVCPRRGVRLGALSLREQVRVKDVIISHSHLDHTCSLPFLIDNNFSAPGFKLRIYAIREVIASMKNHLFNNHTWPDFTCLPNDLTPVLKLVEVPEERAFRVNGLSVRAIRVSHTVPDDGLHRRGPHRQRRLLERHGAHERFWEVANRTKNLKAVIVETSFPNELQDLANVSGHLTPQTLDSSSRKLERDVPVYLYGGKPRHLARIHAQVRSLKRRKLSFLVQGKTYKL
jgi:cAMP phosphodiesterase